MAARRRAAALLGLAAGYTVLVRPRLIRWGATDAEVSGPFPGADLIPGGERIPTMAVTIDAEPSRVWPWLVQMGADRAGWYSWDRIDNFGNRSAERIHPEWQSISLGDRMAGTPDGRQSWEVAALEPERVLGLRISPHLRGVRTDLLWAFALEELPGRRTRLVVGGHWRLRPRRLQRLLSVLLLEPSHWVMQGRQLQNLRRRAEASEL